MLSICNFPHTVRVFNHIQPLKFVSSHQLHFLQKNDVVKSCWSSSRIICTSSTRQSALSPKFQTKAEIIPYQESLCVKVLFPNDNLDFSNSHCLKQLSFPSETPSIDAFIHDKEFKELLATSSFYYNVNLIENAQRLESPFSIYYYSFEDVYRHSFGRNRNREPINNIDQVLMAGGSEVQENSTGKPTESQLLFVIDKLTNQLHNFFSKTHDYSFYHKNVIFQNNIKGVTIRGLSAYIQTMYILKFYGRVRFGKVNVEILKITHHIEDGTVRVRWRVNGVPLHKILLKAWKTKSFSWKQQEETEWLDGFSVFSVGQDGLIYHHVCDKMTPNSDTVISKKADLKSRLLGLFDVSPRGPAAGSLNALIPCYQNQGFSSFKKPT